MGSEEKEIVQKSNKKNIAIAVLVLLLGILGCVGTFEYIHIKKVQKTAREEATKTLGKKPSDYEVGLDYNQAIKSDKPMLVLFYADWCRYCIKFMPIFEKLATKYNEDIVFSKVNAEDPKYQALVEEIRLGGFPTVYFIDKKYDNKVLVSNAFLSTEDDLSKEIERFIRIRKLLDSKK